MNHTSVAPSTHIRRSLELLSDPTGHQFEIRAPKPLNGEPILVKQFNRSQIDAAVLEVISADDHGAYRGLYCTLNPVQNVKGKAASDLDVVCRRWMLIDCDPVRPAESSAKEAEHQAALDRCTAIRAWLTDQGWPSPVVADSGNGGHLLYRLDLPNTQETTGLIRGCLQSLKVRFSDAVVVVDTAVSNPSRITKLYGTVSRKGSNTEDRPWRRSLLIDVPDLPIPVPVEKLQQLKDSTVEDTKSSPASSVPPASQKTPADLSDADLFTKASAASNGATFLGLWSGQHTGDDSAADLALCNLLAFWTGNNAEQMDRMFRQSRLIRDKWDVIHDSGNRRTYGQMTIDRAIAGCREPYSAKKPDPDEGQQFPVFFLSLVFNGSINDFKLPNKRGK